MQRIKFAQMVLGRGLEGDRYHDGTGAFSESKRQVIRHVSLISAEAVRRANAGRADELFEAIDTRRNIFLSLSVEQLNNLVGRDFNIGSVWVRGVELCDPCDRPSKLCQKRGFKEAFDGIGGLRVEVLSSGMVSIGDAVFAI